MAEPIPTTMEAVVVHAKGETKLIRTKVKNNQYFYM
jgi:hypothetical protein